MKYNNSLKNILLPLIVALSLTIGLLLGWYLPGKKTVTSVPGFIPAGDKISSMMALVEAKYVDTVNRNELEETAIPAILKKLDPHSVYIPARDLSRANEPLQGNFEGIGISFNMLTDTILVISTIPGGPSEKAGLLPGDKIIYVNDSLVAGVNIPDDDIVSMLKGPRGSTVRIKILRKSTPDLISFEITRDKIPIHTIEVAYMIDESTGFIKIANFAITTFDEFMESLMKLKASGMKKLIVDLRSNAGGVMDAAIMIADQFLAEGQMIVYTEGRAYPREEIKATAAGEFHEGDLVIIIDEWSASASEIVAGAVQDNDRGTIIGRRSFGKGLVQEPIMFRDGSGLRLTIARYYTPTGRSIQKPYDNGFDEYYNDLNDRFTRGEFAVADSIHLPDSLRFVTPGGRTVYGGGGIMPDIFIPIDTAGVTPYFIRVRNGALIIRYALRYTEDNREKLSEFSSIKDLENYLDNQGLLEKFIAFAEENGIRRDDNDLKISGDLIHIQVKAYIARNILDNEGFYPIWQELDSTLKIAIDYLDGRNQ
ncbi:MAG: S41 family peptidase [Bacteroidales bacterium]|jgi:carboxyl-terminal processing protease|nr:S41 family peptidase [Bacteroidales bacterium]